MLQTYKKWYDKHYIELYTIEPFREARVELISILKKKTMTPIAKEEPKEGEHGSSSVDEGISSKDSKEKVSALKKTLEGSVPQCLHGWH